MALVASMRPILVLGKSAEVALRRYVVNKSEKLNLLLVGMLAGIGFSVACADGFPQPANAQTTSCVNWEVKTLDEKASEEAVAIEPGWEPFSTYSNFGAVAVRRCAD